MPRKKDDLTPKFIRLDVEAKEALALIKDSLGVKSESGIVREALKRWARKIRKKVKSDDIGNQ